MACPMAPQHSAGNKSPEEIFDEQKVRDDGADHFRPGDMMRHAGGRVI